jgi:hypothetical protein
MHREPKAPRACADRNRDAVQRRAGPGRRDENRDTAKRACPDRIDHPRIARTQLNDPDTDKRYDEARECERKGGGNWHAEFRSDE